MILFQTYSAEAQVPDSAGTATAFAYGEKTRDAVIGVNENVIFGNCSSMAGNEIRSIVHYAQDEGRRTNSIVSCYYLSWPCVPTTVYA